MFCAFRHSETISFYDLDNLYKAVPPRYCHAQRAAGHMTSTSELLFYVTRTSQIKCVDCSMSEPSPWQCRTCFGNIQGLCCIPGSIPYLVLADDKRGLLCYEYQLKHKNYIVDMNLIWHVNGRLRWMEADFCAGKVVCSNNRLFVHDTDNNGIRTFNKDGTHTGVLLTTGRNFIGSTIQDIGWQQQTNALLVAHQNDDKRYRYSKIDVNYGTVIELPLPAWP